MVEITHQLREIRIQTDPGAALRTETMMGREYLVAPVVMIQEGVLHGANARFAEFCPGEELAVNTVQWNGRPIVLNHPQVQGVYVSANAPSVLQDWSFGYIFNTTYDGGSKKLKAEAWIDTARASELAGDFQDVVDRINTGEEPVEVSTGLYTGIITEEGSYEGRRYNGRWQNIVSDHLAILPNTQGACSVADGCGIPRINTEAVEENKPLCVYLADPDLTNQSNNADCECGGTCGGCGGHNHVNLNAATPTSMTPEEQANLSRAQAMLAVQGIAGTVMLDDAYSILARAVQKKYEAQYDYSYVTSISSEVCIFCAFSGGWSNMATYSVNYDLDAQGNVTFTSEPIEVILMTTAAPAPTVNASDTTAAGGGGTSTIAQPPAKQMNPELDPAHDPDEDAASADKPGTTTAKNNTTETAPTQPKVQTMDEYLANAPPAIRDLLEGALKLQADNKAALVNQIKANKGNKLTDEQLNAFSTDVLVNLVSMLPSEVTTQQSTVHTREAAPQVNYAGRGGATVESEVTTGGARVNADENDYGAPNAPKVFETRDVERPRPGAYAKH